MFKLIKASKPKIFTKERIANVSAAVIIFWTFYLWWLVVDTILKGGIHITDQEITIAPSMAIIMTILGMMNGFAGFAAKYLWDACTE